MRNITRNTGRSFFNIDEKILLSMFIVAAVGLRMIYFNYFLVPDTDFFDMRSTAIALIHMEFPSSLQRLPAYSFSFGLLSTLLPVQKPILFAAGLINLAGFACSSILLYLISRRFLGQAAFIVVLLFGLHPQSVYMTVQPKAEMLTITFVLLGLYLTQKAHRKTSYLFAMLASLTRYEGVFTIPALGLKDMLFSKRRPFIIALIFFSSTGIMTWICLNFLKTGHFNPYYHYFMPDLKSSGLSYPMLIVSTFFRFGPIHFLYAISGLLAALVLFGLTIIGFWAFYRKSSQDFLPILFYFLFCSLLHATYFAPTPQSIFTVMWIYMMATVGGIYYLILIVAKKLPDSSKTNFARIPKKMSVFFYTIIFALGIVLLKASGFLEFDAGTQTFYFISLIIMILFVVSNLNVTSRLGMPLSGLLIILLVFANVENLKSVHYRINSSKYKKGELRLAGEWYSHNARPGQTMVVSEPFVVSYYAKDSDAESFIPLGSFKAESVSELIHEFNEMGIDYVVWNSTHGRLKGNEFDYYYYKYKSYLLSRLGEGKDTSHFKLIDTLRSGKADYAFIYKFIYSGDRNL